MSDINMIEESDYKVPNRRSDVIFSINAEDLHFFTLLNKHGLEQYFFQLQNAKIDIGCFRFISENDISDLFKNEIGSRIKFRGLINEWRVSNNMSPIASCCCQRAFIKARSESPSSNSESFSSSNYKFNLNKFLESDIGKKILANYNANNELGIPDREALMTNIVRDHLAKEVPMSIPMFEKITANIVKRFPSEKKEFYFQKEKRCGKLYNKYRSMSTSFRKSGYFKKYLRKRISKNLTETNLEESEFSLQPVDYDKAVASEIKMEKKWE